MSDKIQKNYYAIIPADVRYDKRLKPLARLLYGEITYVMRKDTVGLLIVILLSFMKYPILQYQDIFQS